MNATALLVALYPPAVRQRWGDELAQEITATGPRGWPDTLRGAVRLWLRPADWPETATGQTRRVLAVALFAVTTLAALLLRAVEPTTSLTSDTRHPLTSAWLLPVLTGLVLAAPLPRLTTLGRPGTVRRLVGTTTRTLVAPACALLGLYLIAHTGHVDSSGAPVQALLLVCYWGTLAFTGLRLCVLVGRLGRTAGLVTVPGTPRLRLSLLLVGAGLAAACGQSLAGAVQPTPDAAALALAATLIIPAAAALTAGINLRRPAPAR